MSKLIIGLVGPSASGMWIPIESLRERGAPIYSLSDRLRERAVGVPSTREEWGKLGRKLRLEHGSNFLARVNSPHIWRSRSETVVVDSIRDPGEIDYLRSWFNAKIFGLNAQPNVRYQLMLDRKRGVDPLDEEQFKELDKKDRGIAPDSYAHVDSALAKADLVMEHDGDLLELRKRFDAEFVPWLGLSAKNERGS